MQGQRVRITVSAPHQLSSTDQWALIWSGLAAQFPLRNLHWKPATRTSIRTIQYLDVNIVALETVKEEGASQIPASILDKALLNVYVVMCEDSDMYKNVVKKQVKDWQAQVTSRKNQEWLILLLSRTDVKQNQSALAKMRGTLLDRIRADFNVDKKDRCAQLYWSNDLSIDFKNPAAWAEVISKLKEGIIAAFDSAVTLREEEVRRSESQRTMPGWNFCTFFVLKESLASSFEGVNLLEDALLQYDELEASFFQVLKDKTLWFGKFIEPAPNDDSLPLLSVTKKPYRDLILANTISVFDFRVYLLARQCSLLGQMGKIVEIAHKVSLFLGTFSKALREIQVMLPDYFIESWVYSSALSAVDTCEDWARNLDLDSTKSAHLNAAKGELLQISRSQLDKLGFRLGYLPDEPPFSLCTVGCGSSSRDSLVSPTGKRMSRRVTNADILKILQDKIPFYDLYIRLTNRAIDFYVKAGRRKFALRLHGSLAALDLYRGRQSAALQTFMSLPAHYAPHRWASLESYMLFQSMEAHSSSQSSRDRQWAHTAMAFLNAFVEDAKMELLVGVQDKKGYVGTLVDALLSTAASLESDMPFQDPELFAVDIVPRSERCAGDRDGYLLDVNVNNKLPCEVKVDSIHVDLLGRYGDKLSFTTTATATSLSPGQTTTTLFCPIPLPGSYLLDRVDIRVGRLIFQWTYSSKQKRRQSSLLQERSPQKVVRLPPDSEALQVQIQQPSSVEIGNLSKLEIALMSGRNTLLRAFLKFSSPEVSISPSTGVCSREGVDIKFSEEGVSFLNVSGGQTIPFCLSHSGGSGQDLLVNVDIEYVTTSEPTITRQMKIRKTVTTSLALTVNVQDFFRGDRLLMKFTISTTNYQHLRISSVDLRPSSDEIEKLDIRNGGVHQRLITVTPAQPANFMFQLSTKGEVTKPLKLIIKYRMLRQEVETLISRNVKALLSDVKEAQILDAIQAPIVRALEKSSSWVDMYECTGELYIPDVEFNGTYPEHEDRVTELLAKSLPGPPNDDWRQFIIPVDLPCVDILATTCIRLLANPFDKNPISWRQSRPLFAGQPITAVLSINTSYRWAASREKSQGKYRIRFEVEEMIKDWLISGQKRGDFITKDGGTHKISFTLMALRHGEIPLPKVFVTAFHTSEGSTSTPPPTLETYQQHGAEKVLILPRGGKTTFMVNVMREEQ